MATKKKASSPSDIPIKDRSYFYSDLAFMPEDVKLSALWMAQALFFAKLNNSVLVDTKRKHEYRKLSNLELDRQTYVNMIDPPTPMGGGGKATYFSADFKANPIDIHLDNIIRAKLDKIGFENQLQVNEIDKFAKSQRQADKDKLIFQREFRKLINQVNKETGLPSIKESQSPYEYVTQLNGDKQNNIVDNLAGLIDHIRLQVRDSQDLSLYERYVYKGGIERSLEMGIQHYLINQNKWRIKSEYFIDDLKNFNRSAGEWYIDETTGRGIVKYFEPDRLFTSPFKDKNGDDIMYWFYEDDITFADFVRQLGTTLTDEQLKEVFNMNKYAGASHGSDWGSVYNDGNSSNNVRNNSMIRVGRFHILTQEDNKFAETYVNDMQPSWERKPLTWEPDPESDIPKRKVYNVWYSCYYIPPPGERISRNAQADWSWQSRYIFDIQKDVDMYRYGTDMRYARSTLVVWKDIRPSFMDIKQAFMPKIHTTWHKFQNCLVNDITAVGIDYDFMGGLLNAADEGNKINPANPEKPTGGNGIDAGLEAWRMLRQGGMAWLKFRDKNGNIIPGMKPSDFFVNVDNKMLDKAERYLVVILQQYEMLKTALATNNITEGQEAKPRTPVDAINASIAAAKEGLWFVEKPVREFMIMYGERCVQMILNFRKESVKYKFTKRWDEYAEVVGWAQALMVEGIEDLTPEEIGLTVDLEDTTSMQTYIFQLANEMVKNGQLGLEAAGLVMETAKSNFKYAWVLLCLEAKRKEQETADKQDLEYQQQLKLEQTRLQTALALQNAKAQGVNSNLQTQGMIDEQLQQQANQGKYQTQAALTEQKTQSKLQENNQKSDLKKNEETHKTGLEAAKDVLAGS